MRISEWSSDVCSSDLPALGVDAAVARAQRDLARIHRLHRAAGKRLQFGVGVAVQRATAQLAADMRDVDGGVLAVVLARAGIGRGSGWGRVGQYVYISVVAG